jgi:hypothetical protein
MNNAPSGRARETNFLFHTNQHILMRFHKSSAPVAFFYYSTLFLRRCVSQRDMFVHSNEYSCSLDIMERVEASGNGINCVRTKDVDNRHSKPIIVTAKLLAKQFWADSIAQCLARRVEGDARVQLKL